MDLQTQQEWGDEVRGKPWPFVDGATLTSVGGDLVINQSWMADARLWPVLSQPSRLYLRSIERSQSGLSFAVNDLEGTVLTAVVDVSDLRRRRVVFTDVFGYQGGFIQFSDGALISVYDNPSGVYRFAIAATEFVPSVVTPRVSGGVTAVNGVEESIVFSGGDGVEVSGADGGVVVDVVGDPLYRRDTCEDPVAMGRAMHPVRRIIVRDAKKGLIGTATPLNGRIALSIGGEDGFRAPGCNGSLVDMVGGNG